MDKTKIAIAAKENQNNFSPKNLSSKIKIIARAKVDTFIRASFLKDKFIKYLVILLCFYD